MQLLHDYIISLVNLYGIVHKEKVVEIYNKQNNEPIDIAMIDQVMREDSKMLEANFAYIEGPYFVHEAIIMFDDISDILAERIGKPLYIPSKNELLKYKDEFYFEKTKHYNNLLRYVTKNLTDGNKNTATEICEEIQLMIQGEISIGEILNIFNMFDIVFENEHQVSELLDLVTELSNNTRLWVNNGHTPNELLKVERKHLRKLDSKAKMATENQPKPRKVGRNESCPCGSGKKYKKCCLEK